MSAGRYAPSPTGTLHLGNLRTAVAAWAGARSAGIPFLLRIEDIDEQRCRPEFEARQLADLRTLGIDWDGVPLRQSERANVYERALQRLAAAGLAYPCFCSRRDIAESASAPHGAAPGSYPGTCATLSPAAVAERIAAGRQHCWRLRVADAPHRFDDCFCGRRECDLRLNGGDFVLKRADGFYAYQLACAVDDAESGVTEVVRGDDLIDSGLRQSWLLECLGMPVPRYWHLPLMESEGGGRLAKRFGSEDMAGFEARGFGARTIFSYLAWTLGQAAAGELLEPRDLAARWDWARVPRTPATFREQDLARWRPA